MNKFIKRQTELKEKQRQFVYKKKADELYFAKQRITSLDSFEDFKDLKFLWLNGNKLCHLATCLQHNVLLVELYLHNNKIYSVTGCLQHLKSLQVLFLQNNFLASLRTVLHEFRNMYRLQILNLFENPVAFEPNYETRVISSLPSLQIFDRNEVTTLVQRTKLIKNRRNQVLADPVISSAFSHQLLSDDPQKPHQAKTKWISEYKKSAHGPAPLSQNNEEEKKNEEEEEEENCHKASNNTILIYNSLNWKQVASSGVRQTMNERVIKAEIISHVYQ